MSDIKFTDEDSPTGRRSVFTDLDLKRLKETITGDIKDAWMYALLARLEAAEKVCLWDRVKGYPAFLLAKAAWRKSKGDVPRSGEGK